MPDQSAEFVHQSLLTRVVCRPGAMHALGQELDALGCKRPLVLASRRGRAMPQYAEMLAGVDVREAAEGPDIPAHSGVDVVREVAGLIAAHRADSIVAFGGGSVSDTAKAAALLAAEGGELADHATRFTPPSTVHVPRLLQNKLPIVSIPLTASGAEVTPSLGVRTEAGSKLLFWDPRCASRVILIDAALNLAVPAPLMLQTGMNGLAHCVEGLYSSQRSPVTTALALDGLRRFDAALRGVAEDPDALAPRGELLVAAHLSGMVLASARSCLHHALCHVLGATTGAGHGALNAVMLPHAVRYNLAAAREPLTQAARALSQEPQAQAEAVVDWLVQLQGVLGIAARLRDLGVSQDVLPSVARHTLHERGLAYNPRRVEGADELEALLRAAW